MRGCRGVWYARIKQVSVSWLLLELTVTEFAEITRKKKKKEEYLPERKSPFEMRTEMYTRFICSSDGHYTKKSISAQSGGVISSLHRKTLWNTTPLNPSHWNASAPYPKGICFPFPWRKIFNRILTPTLSWLFSLLFLFTAKDILFAHTHTHTQNK